MFMDAIRDNILENHNISITENGAIGYETTGKNLLDLNFSVASLRNTSEAEIAKRFYNAFLEDKNLAMRWLFFARDIRGGLGERRLFRAVIEALSMEDPEVVKAIIPLVPEYGRYDDLWCLLNTPVNDVVISFVAKQFESDIAGLIERKPISLLGKWAPSPSASSRETKRYAKIIAKGLGLTERDYRKGLSKIRKYLDIVEVKMSAKRWGEINYETVPSRANLIYNNAFLRNDEERRQEYLESLRLTLLCSIRTILFINMRAVTIEAALNTMKPLSNCGRTFPILLTRTETLSWFVTVPARWSVRLVERPQPLLK